MSRTDSILLSVQTFAGVALVTLGLLPMVWPTGLPAWIATGGPTLLVAGTTVLLLAGALFAARAAVYLPPPAWSRVLETQIQAHQVQVEGEMKRLRDDHAAASASRDDFQRAYVAERSARERAVHQIETLQAALINAPPTLIEYYAQGTNGVHVRNVQTLARSIVAPWKALEGTMAVEVLAPFFAQVQRVVADSDAARPVHHYTNADVLRMFEDVSNAWRKDEWFQKALRWMEQRYATR